MPTNESPEATIEEAIATALRVDQAELTDETVFGPEGLDVDSLSVLEMAETIDVELGVTIPDADLEDLETVGDVKTYVADELA
jgi:acyl carrier protein